MDTKNRIYGYARVSTKGQKLERQLTNLLKFDNTMTIYQEKYSGISVENRKELQRLLKVVSKGDNIVFDSVSRMSRNADEGFQLYLDLFDKGINLVFLNERHIDTDVFRKQLQNAQAVQCPYIKDSEAVNSFMSSICKALRELFVGIIKEQIKAAFQQAEKERVDLASRISQGHRERKAKGLPDGGQCHASKHRKSAKKDSRMKFILSSSRAFGGTMKDSEIKAMIGISSQTLYTYKKELKEQLAKQAIEEIN